MEYGQGYKPYGPSDREKALLIQLLLKRKQQEAQQSQSASGGTDTLLKAAIGGGGGASLLGGSEAATSTLLDSPISLTPEGGLMNYSGDALGGSSAMFSGNGLLNSGAMTTMDYVPGVAGAIGAYDLFKNKKHGGKGALQGAASGAGLGYTLGGPVGAGVGALVGGGLGYFGNFGDKDMWQTEQKRLDDLRAKGMKIPQGLRLTGGRSKQQLIDEAKATGGNVKFAESRNEGDLTPQDIQGYASLYDKGGEDLNKRLEWAKKALDAKAVREHHGTIDVDWSKVDSGNQIPKATQSTAQNNSGFTKEPLKINPAVANKVLPKLMIPRSGARGN